MKIFLAFILLLVSGHHLRSQSKTIIYFESSKSQLESFSISTLDSIAKSLKFFTEYNIIITGHCDITGNKNDNQLLSENRARSIG
ncbi:MAG: OmpA family protein, partial [Bacteroidetes bacterium]|nr:OmpA family protein [Bacteroidota bacterium]